ncbi:MAG: 3-isopropylmalate dehydratase [Phycisphaerales bacterium]|nr:3-isopropylmalate dehydratase [Phycisphaerales bacterium]
MSTVIRGKAYVVGDNIDTDQIIPAQYLALVPTIEEEYRKLGTYALCGLPVEEYPTRLTENEKVPCPYNIIIAGRNFGCGSSREHAPIALGAAGVEIVIAESFARIFFRNCIATGELYPADCPERLCEVFKTGDALEIDLDALTVKRAADGASHALNPLGEVKTVVAAGGLFAYARETGLVPERSAAS